MNPYEDFIIGALWLLGGAIVFLSLKALLEAMAKIL